MGSLELFIFHWVHEVNKAVEAMLSPSCTGGPAAVAAEAQLAHFSDKMNRFLQFSHLVPACFFLPPVELKKSAPGVLRGDGERQHPSTRATSLHIGGSILQHVNLALLVEKTEYLTTGHSARRPSDRRRGPPDPWLLR